MAFMAKFHKLEVGMWTIRRKSGGWWRLPRVFGVGLPRIRPVFLHIPKTAGLSIRHALAERYNPCWSVSVTVDGDMPRVWTMPEWKFHRCAYYAGHFGMETVRRVTAEKFVFTFLREPFDRVLSHYYYFKREDIPIQGAKLAKKLPLLDYLKCDDPAVRDSMEDRQARQLIESEDALERRVLTMAADPKTRAAAAIMMLGEFDIVGLTERFNESLDIISHAIGVKLTAHRDNQTADRPSANDLSLAERDAVEQLIQADRIVYRWAVEIWNGRHIRGKGCGRSAFE
jgi:Sulfotransferase family